MERQFSIHTESVHGKRILITGATSGLGLAMAKALVSAGGRVMITGRDSGKVDSVVQELRTAAGEVDGAVIDVRDEKSVAAALERISGRWGGIDVLVNNAGIGMRTISPRFLTDPMPFWEIPSEKFRDLIDTNLTGYFLVAKHAVPYFIRQGSGRIINISVSFETMRRKGFIPYGPSRAATESLSHIMAEDLKPFGITVNMLLPGGPTNTGSFPRSYRQAAALRYCPRISWPNRFCIFVPTLQTNSMTSALLRRSSLNGSRTKLRERAASSTRVEGRGTKIFYDVA